MGEADVVDEVNRDIFCVLNIGEMVVRTKVVRTMIVAAILFIILAQSYLQHLGGRFHFQTW